MHHFLSFRTSLLLVVGVWLLFPLSTLGQEAASSPERKMWRIGGVVALTGAASGWGEMARMGWELAIAQANTGGGVRGIPVSLLLEDSQTNPARAVAGFKKLREVHKVDALVGDVWDFITTPLIPLADSAQIVLVSSIIDQSTHQHSPYFFTAGPRISSVIPAVKKFFEIHPAVKSVGILGWDNDWGYAYESVWTSAAAQAGARVVEIQRSMDIATDWRTEVTRLAPKRPDAIFFGYQADRILKRLREARFRPAILTTSNIVEELVLRSVSQELSEGIFYTDWPASEEFITAFKAKHARDPILNAIEAYEAMRSLLKAIELTPHDLREGMSKVAYQGVNGHIDFTGDRSGNFAEAKLFKVSTGAGKLVP